MKTVTITLSVAACVSSVQAHTYLTQPLAEFKAGASKSSWVAEFQPPWTGTFKTGAQYAAVAPGKGYKDLRSFLEDKGPTCGNTLSNASPKPIPSDGTIKLASTIEHAGPCEVWLDDTMAFHDDDCEKTFGSATSFKVDFSSCKGSCMLRFYWLGLQDGGKRWQSYKNCIPLGGGGGGASSTNSNSNKSSDSNANSNKNSDSNKNSNANGNANGNSNKNSDSNKNSNKNSNSDSNSTKNSNKSSESKSNKSSDNTSDKSTKRSKNEEEYSFRDLDAWSASTNTTSE